MTANAERIAITGIGLTSAAGAGADALVDALLKERCALAELDDDIARGLAMRTGGRVPESVIGAGVDPRDRARIASGEAIAEALASAGVGSDRQRIGLALGTGLGSVGSGSEPSRADSSTDARRGRVGEIAPHALTHELAHAFELGGPRATFSATCVSASYALEEAIAALTEGRADRMVCGGVDMLGRFIQAGFCRLGAFEAILSDDGFVLGEAAAFVVLERFDDARARGAAIEGVLTGRALHSDSSHLTSPDEDGRGMTVAIEAALSDAGTDSRDVGRVSVSAIASPKYELMYARSLERVFGSRAVERATWEPSIGHVLAASGVLGLAFACWHHAGRFGPPPDGDVLVLTVGFGGQNGAAVVAAPEREDQRTNATPKSEELGAPLALWRATGIAHAAPDDLERSFGGRWDARRGMNASVRTLVAAVSSAVQSAGWWEPGQEEPIDGGLIVGTDLASIAAYRRFASRLADDGWTHASDFLFGLPSTAAAVVGLALGLERYQATIPAEGAAGFAAVAHAVGLLQTRRLKRVVVAAHTRLEPETLELMRLERAPEIPTEEFDLAVAWCLEAGPQGARGASIDLGEPGESSSSLATSAALDDVPVACRELAGPSLLAATRRFESASEAGLPSVVRHRDSCFDETALIRLRPSL